IFPDDDKVQIQTKVLEISLNAREKQTYTLRYQTSGSAVYNPEIEVKVKTQDSTEQQYFTHESTPILTNRGCDAKGTKSDAFIIAANSYVKMPLKNQNNWAYFYSDQKPTTTRYSPCDFGQPYSGEFEEQDPERICYSQSGDSASMEVFYESRKHIGLKFSKVFTLFPSGELDLVFKFQNIPDDAMDLNLRQRISFYIKECKFMQNSEVISMLTDCDQLTLDDFDPNSISEPWIFAKQSSDNTHCLTWHKGWNLSFEYNFLLLDVALADIKSTMDMKSPAIRVYHNLFQSAGAFRNFVMGKSFDSPAHYNSVDVISNNHNPIFPDVIALKPVHHHKLSLEHTLEIPSQNYSASATEDTIHSLPLDNAGLSILDAKLRFPYFDLDCKRLILNSVGTIDTHEGASEITINNGSLSFSAAKDNRFPLISSLKMDVIECLESAEPDFGPRAGRNPFVGGLFMMPSSMNEAKLLREKHVLQRADYYDQYQNLWQGLSWETAIEEIEFLKGARYRSLFLTMPGIPVLLNSVEIVSWPKRTGYESFYQYIFVNSKNVLPDAVFGFLDEHGNWQEYRKSEYACYPQGNYAVSRIRNEKISMNVMSDLYGHSAFTVKAQYLMARNMVYSRELCKAGDILDPIFIVFSNANLNDKMAQDLLRIKLTKA
ncbi:MAG: hypothetical protein PHQ78_05935, partial [Candidatus Cloacimonetes bacterium]|nr:hypothetical protein [Candidatus Cloacimonadota bacterium]